MPTPKDGYRNAAGDEIPGYSKIGGRFKDSGALMQWAFKQGKSGHSHLYEKSKEAAEIGTIVHEMVEWDIKGDDPSKPLEGAVESNRLTIEQGNSANLAFNAYRAWKKNFHVRVIEQEILLVSEEYQFGGTPDAVGYVGNSLCLLDWKTSNGVYVEYLIQLAAYGHLWNINRPDNQLEGGFHLLRFSKESGDFAHHYFSELADAWEQFKLFRKAYDIDQKLKKRV